MDVVRLDRERVNATRVQQGVPRSRAATQPPSRPRAASRRREPPSASDMELKRQDDLIRMTVARAAGPKPMRYKDGQSSLSQAETAYQVVEEPSLQVGDSIVLDNYGSGTVK